MHPAPRTIYDTEVDFAALARQDPDFNRCFNYILWVQDLLDTTTSDDDYYRASGYDEEREVVGLDIGTGSSCIYPLLGCAQRPKWRFIATGENEPPKSPLPTYKPTRKIAQKTSMRKTSPTPAETSCSTTLNPASGRCTESPRTH
ncbi:MAG: hypothetical protein Q9173_007363 [Seirophora scorigena]